MAFRSVSHAEVRAVLPAHVRRRWDAIALPQLCEALARESEEIERLRTYAYRADVVAESWRDEALNLQQAFADMTGNEPGITQEGALVLVPAGGAS